MTTNFRLNEHGNIKLVNITPCTLLELLQEINKSKRTMRFECPVCYGKGQNITPKSLIDLSNHVDDYGNSDSFVATYKKCMPCTGTGKLSMKDIHLGFCERPNRPSRGIVLVLPKEKE